MAKLILSLDGSVLNEILLAKERTTIGRRPHNDIQIDNLAVSGEHAAIVSVANDCILEDLGSTNGTLVNGAPVKKHLLRDNDVIEFGKFKLKYVRTVDTRTAADYDKTMVWSPAASKPAGAAAAPAPAPMAAAASPHPETPHAVPERAARRVQSDHRADKAAESFPYRFWMIALVLLGIVVVGYLAYRGG
jgi:pSer/pThr/pTyr-binding forkhead associated (FHA) protein